MLNQISLGLEISLAALFTYSKNNWCKNIFFRNLKVENLDLREIIF